MGILLITILQGIVPLASAWVTKLLFDQLALRFQEQASPWSSLVGLLLLQTGLTTFNQLLHPINSYLNGELNRQLLLNVQIAIFSKINHLASLTPFENPQTHNMLQKAVQGAQYGPAQALGTLTSLLHSTITLVSFLGVLATFNPLLAGLVALATLPELYAQIKMARQRYGLVEANTPKQRYVGYFSGIFSAPYFAKELRIFNLGNYFLTRFRNLTKELNYSQRTQDQNELRWQFGLELFTKLVVSTAFVVVVMQAFQGYLSLGDVTLYTNAISSVQAALSGMVFSLANVHESSLFFSHYTRLLALPQPIYIAPTPQPALPLLSAIELRGVSFRYSEEHSWILQNVNLSLPAGQSLALIGLNGAGKTTLVKLLTRLYDPTEGQILWDGVDIRDFDPVELRRRMGVIFQDFVRFDLTALENIALGDVTILENDHHAAAETAARRAAQKAGIHEMVAALPHGYNTTFSRWLAEDGQGLDLSGGEWQKIALARLFMRDADFLILDEPTAAMDAQAEHDIYQSFTEIVAGKTSLLISHRFSTVRMADLIAVLENGTITEYGSHDELMSQEGTYARLYNMQAERYR